MALRNFPAELEALADVWSTTATSTDTWVPTGKEWNTNSRPIMVANQNNQRGVAKPGQPIHDRCLRAAHEKIVSDLAYVLGLPVPPVILWDRGEGFAGDRCCAISAWAFRNAIEWHHVRGKLSPAQLEEAKSIAGAMRAFDTWIAASDRKNDHILVNDDGDTNHLGVAYIDYAFALSHEWSGQKGSQPGARPAWPNDVEFDPGVCGQVAEAIEKLEEQRISQIVNRVPAGYFSLDGARDVILSTLLSRRKNLSNWLA